MQYYGGARDRSGVQADKLVPGPGTAAAPSGFPDCETTATFGRAENVEFTATRKVALEQKAIACRREGWLGLRNQLELRTSVPDPAAPPPDAESVVRPIFQMYLSTDPRRRTQP